MLGSLRRRSWLPANDNAILEIQLHDLPHHFLMTGAYSRFGWAHPGPIPRLLLAPLYWAFGSTGFALAVSTAALSIGFLVVAARALSDALGVRRSLVVVLTCAVLAVIGLSGEVLVSPWNPYLATVALFASACSLLAVAQGRWAWMAVSVGLASFAVQAHVQTTVPVALAALAAVALGLRVSRPDARASLATLAVGLAMWALPVLEAATHAGGNIRKIGGFAIHNPDPPIGMWHATKVVGYWTSLRSPALGFAAPIEPIGNTVDLRAGNALLPGILLILAIAGCWLSRSRAVRSSAVVIVAAVIGTWIALSRTTGSLHEYTFIWLQPLVTLLLGLGAIGFAERILARAPGAVTLRGPTFRRLTAAGTAVLVLVWVALQPAPNAVEQASLRNLAPRIAALAGQQGVHWTSNADGGMFGLTTGLVRPLERRGVPVSLDSAWAGQLQYDRSEPVEDARLGLRWGCGIDPTVDPSTVLLSFDPFRASERARMRRLQAILQANGDELAAVRAQLELTALTGTRLCVDVVDA